MSGNFNGFAIVVLAAVVLLTIVASVIILVVRSRREHRAARKGAIAAGWYLDPADSTLQRYWDGSAWTEHVSHVASEPEGTR